MSIIALSMKWFCQLFIENRCISSKRMQFRESRGIGTICMKKLTIRWTPTTTMTTTVVKSMRRASVFISFAMVLTPWSKFRSTLLSHEGCLRQGGSMKRLEKHLMTLRLRQEVTKQRWCFSSEKGGGKSFKGRSHSAQKPMKFVNLVNRLSNNYSLITNTFKFAGKIGNRIGTFGDTT